MILSHNESISADNNKKDIIYTYIHIAHTTHVPEWCQGISMGKTGIVWSGLFHNMAVLSLACVECHLEVKSVSTAVTFPNVV